MAETPQGLLHLSRRYLYRDAPQEEALALLSGVRSRRVVVCVGDSNTEFAQFTGPLAFKFERRADVVNRGYSGYNSRWLLKLLTLAPDDYFPRERVALVTLLIGTNDAQAAEAQQVPLEEYERNVEDIVKWWQERCPSAYVLVLGPPPTRNAAVNPKVEGYSDAAARAAGRRNAGFASLFEAFRGGNAKTTDEELAATMRGFLYDDVHLDAKGGGVVADATVKHLRAGVPHLRPKFLPVDAPVFELLAQEGTQAMDRHLRRA